MTPITATILGAWSCACVAWHSEVVTSSATWAVTFMAIIFSVFFMVTQ